MHNRHARPLWDAHEKGSAIAWAKVLHRNRRAALRQVYTEVMISCYYHRKGLWQVRRKSLSKPEMLLWDVDQSARPAVLISTSFPEGRKRKDGC